MNDQKAKLGIGALLHDIGKVIYRRGMTVEIIVRRVMII